MQGVRQGEAGSLQDKLDGRLILRGQQALALVTL